MEKSGLTCQSSANMLVLSLLIYSVVSISIFQRDRLEMTSPRGPVNREASRRRMRFGVGGCGGEGRRGSAQKGWRTEGRLPYTTSWMYGCMDVWMDGWMGGGR